MVTQHRRQDWQAPLKASQIRVLRVQAARVAEVCASCWSDALAADDYYAAAYWSGRYSSAAAQCAELGLELRRSDGERRAPRGQALGDRS